MPPGTSVPGGFFSSVPMCWLRRAQAPSERLAGGPCRAGASVCGSPVAALLTHAWARPGVGSPPLRGWRRPGARSCSPAPPARKNEWFLCTRAPAVQSRPARATRGPLGRFFYAVLCAMVMQVATLPSNVGQVQASLSGYLRRRGTSYLRHSPKFESDVS